MSTNYSLKMRAKERNSRKHSTEFFSSECTRIYSPETYSIKLCTYLLLEVTKRIEMKELMTSDEKIDNFYIANNMANSGHFDDLVFKYSSTDTNSKQRHHVSFIQTKHRNKSLEQIVAKGSLRKYFESYRRIKKQTEKNDPIFSTSINDIDFVLFINKFKSKHANLENYVNKYTNENNSFLNFHNTNEYYKLDVNFKLGNAHEHKTIMELLCDNRKCKTFVKNLVEALFSDKCKCHNEGLDTDCILFIYQKPILCDVINITVPGVGTFKPDFATGDLSPFEKYFIHEITNKFSKPLNEISVTLPLNFGDREDITKSKSILPFTRKYFEEFLNKVKFYVKQPDEFTLRKEIEQLIENNFPVSKEDTLNVCTIILARVKDWWFDNAAYVDYLDNSNTIIKDSANLSIRFNVVNPVHNFTGRLTELKHIHELRGTETASTIRQAVVVYGLGGIGKTELVRKYIRDFGKSYDGNIIWITSDDQTKITESLNELYRTKLKFIHEACNGSDDDLVMNVFKYFSKKASLFVFDNAENTEDFQKILALIDGFKIWTPRIIITSRDAEWENKIQTFRLDVLKRDEAFQFIRNGLGDDYQEDEYILKLAETLQYFPLAVQQAISYIRYQRFCEKYSIEDFIKEFYKHKAQLLDSTEFKHVFNDYKYTTFKTWLITKKKIELNPLGGIAMYILRTLAYCAPECISTNMFLNLPDMTEKNLKDGIHLLVKYCMVDENDNGTKLAVHRLVQDVTRIAMANDRNTNEEHILQDVLIILDSNITSETLNHFMVVWKYASNYKELINKYGHTFTDIINMLCQESRIEDAFMFLKHFTLNDENIINVHIETGKTLLKLHKSEKATELYQSLLCRIPADNKEQVYKVKSQLGKILVEESRYAEALELFENLLRNVAQDLDPRHPTTIQVREDIAIIHRKEGAIKRWKSIYCFYKNRIKLLFDDFSGGSTVMMIIKQTITLFVLCVLYKIFIDYYTRQNLSRT